MILRVARRLARAAAGRLLPRRGPGPWMCYEEIELIEDVLGILRPSRCLEWGAGYSTLRFPERLERSARWDAVEHDRAWAERIEGLNRRPNTRVWRVAPNRFPFTDPHGDGAGADLADYVAFPERLGRFDFVLVDGRARKECLAKARELLEERGVVVLHDAERGHYRGAFSLFPRQVLLSGYREDGKALWLGSRARDVEALVRPGSYQRLWAAYRALGRARFNSRGS